MNERVTSRAATPGDHATFLRLFAELEVDDPMPPLEAWTKTMMPGVSILERAGETVGYGLSFPLGEVGYVFHVVVDPARRRERIGYDVMRAVAARLRGLGCARWCLNVKRDNAPAIRLYERVGMKRVYGSSAIDVPWSVPASLPAAPEGVTACVVDPADDAAIEAGWSMPRGRLAQQRAQPERVLFRVVDPARPGEVGLGVACFARAFPGAFPFRVASIDLASPLFAVIRAHARPDDASLHVLVEDDDALANALVERGASVRFDLWHFEGDLPPA
ncbi:MAG TPA: GNAT family N-acetyltransferase [Byssovorax sp.]|jgi:GNAT superfamily N-acetyltransferase